MTFSYMPNVGYGPLRFGMTPLEVETILGEPSSFRSPFEGIPLPDDDQDLLRHCEGLRFMEFPQTRTSHQFPQVSFDRDRVTGFTLFDIKVPFLLNGIDLFARSRKATLAALAANETEYFENGERFLFQAQGVELPNAKYAKTLPYVSLVDATYVLAHRDFNFLEPSTSLG